MKTIGRTNEGGYLVEMTQNEHITLLKLSETLKRWDYIPLHDFLADDLEPAFKAILDLANAKHSINKLLAYIHNLDNLFGSGKSIK